MESELSKFNNQWIVFIFSGIFYIFLYLKYYRPIKKIKAEAACVFKCFGKGRLIAMVTWLTVLTLVLIFVIYIKPNFWLFLYISAFGVIPFSYISLGTIYVNDYELFIDGTVYQISSIDKIHFEVRSNRNGTFYYTSICSNDGIIKHKYITFKAADFLAEHFTDKCFYED
ncbi:MAG TPA: hypothetical protein PKI60_07925 [Oscillospiraceae bacterium]|nr:hypothetical protein [Oscillospiraceae bacterium]